jgi:hypothetical protein
VWKKLVSGATVIATACIVRLWFRVEPVQLLS